MLLAIIFVVLAVLGVVVIGLVVIGRETATQAARARPIVFQVDEAIYWIGERLPADVQARLSHADVRWVLLRDADLLEEATLEQPDLGPEFVDEDTAIARILAEAENDPDAPELEDADVVAILDARADYLEFLGAIGPRVADPPDPDGPDTPDAPDTPGTPGTPDTPDTPDAPDTNVS